MGARVIFNIKQSENSYLHLYSHWGEGSMYQDLARALEAARPRWQDVTYGARIIVSQIVGEEWNQELGFGLWSSDSPCYDETNIEIDLLRNIVIDESGEHSFESFVEYHKILV